MLNLAPLSLPSTKTFTERPARFCALPYSDNDSHRIVAGLNIFIPMAKKSYSEKLKHPNWQKKRLSILNRDNFTCQLCQDTETELQIHHTQYTASEPYLEPDENLITLCKHCHLVTEAFHRDGMEETQIIKLVKVKSLSGYTFYIRFSGDTIGIMYHNPTEDTWTAIARLKPETFKRIYDTVKIL